MDLAVSSANLAMAIELISMLPPTDMVPPSFRAVYPVIKRAPANPGTSTATSTNLFDGYSMIGLKIKLSA